MHYSTDPAHDIDHVRRVVRHVKILARQKGLSAKDREALVLAAWWHDVSRTTTKRPSFIVMPLIDDMLSALLLWRETIRCGFFGSTVGISTRIILCKSFGTGRLFTQLLLRKKDRIMLDILKDADMLDLLNTNRMERLMSITEGSRVYQFGYKTMIWWFLQGEQLYMKTYEARQYVEKLIREFLAWIRTPDVFAWHIEQFGRDWIEKNLVLGDQLLSSICSLNLSVRST